MRSLTHIQQITFLKQIGSYHLGRIERHLALATVAQAEEEANAGFPPVRDSKGRECDVFCRTCGAPTEDDSDDFCRDHMPVCIECDLPRNKLDDECVCEDCRANVIDRYRPENYAPNASNRGGAK